MFTNETDRMLADGGVMQEGGTVDPVSGNDVPPGAMQEEVRDDIDAKLSEGEFVIPADVVRYIGLSTLMKMRDKAKEGLKKMEEIGQMGNAEEVPNAEALHGGESEEMDEESFGAEVDSILGEEKEEEETPAFAEGGYVDPANASTYRDAPIRGFEMVRMVNAAGNVIYIPHTNGKPMLSVPAGYTPSLSTLPPVTETPTTPSPSTGGAGAGGAGGADSGGGGGGGPAGGGAGGAGGAGGGGAGGSSYGVSFDEQGNVVAGKSGISSGQAMFGGTLLSMLTGIPGISLAAMAGNKAYNKAAEAEAAGLRASIADTMGVNANMNTLAATPGISGTGGAAASAAQAAAAEAVASGYSDRAVAAAAQAAANAAMNGASPAAALEAGAQAAAAASNVEAGLAVAAESEAAAAANAQAAAEAATTANDIDATDASAGYSGNGSPASQGQTSSQSGEGNPAESNTTSSSTGEGNPGESGGGFSNDAGGTESSGSLGFVKGGFVSKKKNVLAKSNKGLASRK